MSDIIECPSGLAGEIRGLKVKELDLLADRRLAKNVQQIDRILESCWLETTDPGPYAVGEHGSRWDQVLQGDRFYALLRIRALSLGSDYAFQVMCESDACRQRFTWEVSLEDLPVQPLSAESRARFQTDNRFETTLPGAGTRVWFRLLVGADERRYARHQQAHQDALWSAMLALRVVEIEGAKESDKRRFLEELSLADAEHLREAFDAVDCGVDTTIEVECPACWMTQDVELPFDQRFFLQAKPRKRSSPR